MSTRPLIAAVALWLTFATSSHAQPGNALDGPRLYVLEGGELVANPGNYHLADDEVRSTSLSIAAYLVVHADGVLIFDTLAVADDERVPAGTGAAQTIVRLDLQERYVTLGPSLTEQLSQIGYTTRDVTHVALSHYHWDHTANANLFAHATWLVRPNERTQMFLEAPGGSARPMTYSALKDGPTTQIVDAEHDVFGDGTVVLKAAPGHTPGHQVLFVKLAGTGGIVLAGDLYHYPEERTLDRLPVSDYDVEQTSASRKEVEVFLSRMNAALWIGHDLIAHRALRKAPAFYD